MAHELAYVNGKLLPAAEATVPVHDRSFLYGDGAFDTAVARQGRVFKLDAHIHRLFCSLQVLRIPAPLPKAELREAALDLMRRNRMMDGFLRMVVSRGTCAYVSLDPRVVAGGPTLVILTRGADPPGDLGIVHGRPAGARAVTASALRHRPTRSSPG